MPAYDPGSLSWLDTAERMDVAAYDAVAALRRPGLDAAMRRLSTAADYSKLWIGGAGLMAAFGGARGRRAAISGLASLGVAATVANLIAKPLCARPRPERAMPREERHIRMPGSSAFPSGHSASAFAFATGVAHEEPLLSVPLGGAAAAVGYSRVHTGVHFPFDVIAGGFLGVVLAQLTTRALPDAGY